MRKLLMVLSKFASAVSRDMQDKNNPGDARDMDALAIGLSRAIVLPVSVNVTERLAGDPGMIRQEVYRRLANVARSELPARMLELGDVHYERFTGDRLASPEASGGNVTSHYATARFLIVPLPYGD